MRAISLFGIIALVPAALNVTPAAAAGLLTVPLCTGDGQVHMVNVPLNGNGIPGGDTNGCCAKGCHSGSSRKRASGCHFDPSQ
ncbi:MAG: hypothetical protein KGL44_00955 [Sphingomonadales bacterium]|nr:hypothetical protein [Sphingomonadales bacterium]